MSQDLGLFLGPTHLMTLPATSYLRLEKTGAVIVDIHVIPNASRTQADGEHDGALRVRLHAPPVDGKANDALIAFLAAKLQVRQRDVRVIRGQTHRQKLLEVDSELTPAEVRARLL